MTFAENAVQTTYLGPRGEGESYGGMERPQVHRQQTLRNLVPQEIYTVGTSTGFVTSDVIEFVVNGERGIRLLDALEENWIGFEGRDDRSLFEADRFSINFRLRVSLSGSMRYRFSLIIFPVQPVGCISWNSTARSGLIQLNLVLHSSRFLSWSRTKTLNISQERSWLRKWPGIFIDSSRCA